MSDEIAWNGFDGQRWVVFGHVPARQQ